MSIVMDANQLIDRFITSCSHDLRSPLTSIKGLVQVAELQPHTAEVHECLERINSTTDKMEKLLQSLEEFLATNNHTTEKVTSNCEEMTSTVLRDFEDMLDQESITLRKNIKIAEQNIDPYTFPLMLTHLLSNAVMFQDKRKKKKQIKIDIGVQDRFVLLQVSDNGIGIPATIQPHIFKPFYRGSEYSTGLGMGLFQLSRLVEKSNSQLFLISKENEGSTFSLAIPA
jgi:signal transduction histidine kinase